MALNWVSKPPYSYSNTRSERSCNTITIILWKPKRTKRGLWITRTAKNVFCSKRLRMVQRHISYEACDTVRICTGYQSRRTQLCFTNKPYSLKIREANKEEALACKDVTFNAPNVCQALAVTEWLRQILMFQLIPKHRTQKGSMNSPPRSHKTLLSDLTHF